MDSRAPRSIADCSVLSPKVFDGVALVASEPAREEKDEELKRSRHGGHVPVDEAASFPLQLGAI